MNITPKSLVFRLWRKDLRQERSGSGEVEGTIYRQPIEGPPMRLPRVRFTVRALLIAVAIAAIWSLIIAQGLAYQDRHLSGRSAWGE
jgi:hypothetical protein